MIDLDSEEGRRWALRTIGSVTSSKSGEVADFIDTACLWIAKWCATKTKRQQIKIGYCAIVLNPDASQGTFKPWFKEDLTPSLANNVYVSDYALNRVRAIPGRCADLAETISRITNHALTDRPCVVFDTDSQAVFVFVTGVGSKPFRFQMEIPLELAFDAAEFLKMLQKIYVESLRYPETLPAIWMDPANYIPGREAERTIQGHVCQVLKYSLQGYNYIGGTPIVIRERANNAGRADVVVLVGMECRIASEMKVLRQRYFSYKRAKARAVSAKFNERWANRGARQAARYKVVESAIDGVLVLYDMRKTDADIQSAKKLCSDLGVGYARYFLHNTGPSD
jgi:hypothetical protein